MGLLKDSAWVQLWDILLGQMLGELSVLMSGIPSVELWGIR